MRKLPIERIHPGMAQMRIIFDNDALDDLADSIRSAGLIQPVVVRSIGAGEYELLAGERRWRAAQKAGLHDIPAIVRNDIDDREAMVLGLIENLQRESLSPMETAHGLKELALRLGLTHAQAAERVGKSRVYVTNMLRLLNLAPRVQEMVNAGQLSMGHARALSALDPIDQEHWAGETVAHDWSVRTLEKRLSQRNVEPRRLRNASEWRRLQQQLTDLMGNRVDLSGSAKGKGRLTIHFHSYDELEGVLERLGYSEDF